MALVFGKHVRIVPVEGRGLMAGGEDGCDVFSGPAFDRLATLIDGRRREDEILAACSAADRPEVAAALGDLRRKGVVIERSADVSSTPPPGTSLGPVELLALGGLDTQSATDALGAAGVRPAVPGVLQLVLVDDYLEEELADVNANALENGRPWMLARPYQGQILVGPVFTPDRGPCWECLVHRLRQHNRPLPEPPPLAERTGSLRTLGSAVVATETARWLSGSSPGLETQVQSFDIRRWELVRHTVTWRAQCPACGVSDASLDRDAAPITLRRRGGLDPEEPLRRVTPQAMLDRFGHLVSPLTGAVPGLVRHPGPDYLHVYSARDPLIRVHGDPTRWEWLLGPSASGKGTTDTAARAGALCEALERRSGQLTGAEPRRRASLRELGELALHPNQCMGFSSAQFADRERWNRDARSYRTFVPEPLDPEEPVDWTPVWSLTRECQRLIPTALGYYAADVAGRDACVGDSNGCAAGSTLEEAILHGLLELIERDHVALWWYNALPAPRIDLDSINNSWLQQLRRHLAGEGRELWAVDLTADLGIPVVAALASTPDGSRAAMGYGAAVDLAGATVRAATELVQLGLGGTSGGLGALAAARQLDLSAQPFARGLDSGSVACADEAVAPADLLDSLDRCREAIEAQKIEVLVLDQTRPDIGLPVVKVLAPGMRHFWPRFGPGRLYEVPVQLGRLDRPRTEDELNVPIPTL
jgi:ribosomal protein S12 methylthiotransferase accessory factor